MRRLVVAISSFALVAVLVTLVIGLANRDSRLAERGVNVYVSTDKFKDNAPQAVTERADKIFDYVASLGANAVALNVPIFTDGPRGSKVGTQYKTPSAAMLRLVVASARAHNLRVTFRPIINQDNLVSADGNWRGSIQPANRDAWFASYNATLRTLLELAEELDVETFQIGVELDSLEGDPHWAEVIDAAKAVYKGELMYSVHWEPFANRTEHIPTKQYGISAYPPFDLPDDAAPSDVRKAWDGWFKSVGKGRELGKTGLDEVGIPGAAGMYKRPFTWDAANLPYDGRIQATWFTAACRAAKAHHLRWLYFWKIDFHEDPTQANAVSDPRWSFVGRAGADAIRTCFT